jgi:hypothetical protein
LGISNRGILGIPDVPDVPGVPRVPEIPEVGILSYSSRNINITIITV